jgi:hypothetical protein
MDAALVIGVENICSETQQGLLKANEVLGNADASSC